MSKGPNRFGDLQARLEKTDAGTETGSGRSRLRERFRATEEQDNTRKETAAEQSEFYKTLIDPDIEPEKKVEMLAEMMVFDEEDLEKNPEQMKEMKAVVAQLLSDFKQYNIDVLELIRDNPLSELGTDIKSVFERYHQVVSEREGLDKKLELIDEALNRHGGPEGLVKALHSAKNSAGEQAAFKEELDAARQEVERMGGDLRGLDGAVRVLTSSISEAESDSFLFFKSGKKREIAEQKRQLVDKKIEREKVAADLEEKKEHLGVRAGEYEALLKDDDFMLHQRILEILDVGSPEFKEQIANLAQLTIDYVGDTETILSNSRDQIAALLDRSQRVLNMIQNTGEHVNILLAAQNRAQDINTGKLDVLETQSAEASGLEGMKLGKKRTALNRHITDTSSAVRSSALIGQELGKIETSQVAFVGRLHEGLSDAEEQQLISTGSASMTGVATLSRVESLAAQIPGLIAKGQYAQDSEYALGELNKEFERALAAKISGNDSLGTFTEVLKDVREAMRDRTDLDIEIARQRKGLIDGMIEETEKLARINREAQSIEGAVNKELYGRKPEDDSATGPKGGGAPGAPQGAVLRMVI